MCVESACTVLKESLYYFSRPRSPELAAACEVWKEIKFEFETIDKL